MIAVGIIQWSEIYPKTTLDFSVNHYFVEDQLPLAKANGLEALFYGGFSPTE